MLRQFLFSDGVIREDLYPFPSPSTFMTAGAKNKATPAGRGCQSRCFQVVQAQTSTRPLRPNKDSSRQNLFDMPVIINAGETIVNLRALGRQLRLNLRTFQQHLRRYYNRMHLLQHLGHSQENPRVA